MYCQLWPTFVDDLSIATWVHSDHNTKESFQNWFLCYYMHNDMNRIIQLLFSARATEDIKREKLNFFYVREITSHSVFDILQFLVCHKRVNVLNFCLFRFLSWFFWKLNSNKAGKFLNILNIFVRIIFVYGWFNKFEVLYKELRNFECDFFQKELTTKISKKKFKCFLLKDWIIPGYIVTSSKLVKEKIIKFYYKIS